MKSIMQEASSISKAIEQGWLKAGRPQEFTVKILEEPQKNLMGLITTRSAKIALFFEENKPQNIPQSKPKPVSHYPRKEYIEHPSQENTVVPKSYEKYEKHEEKFDKKQVNKLHNQKIQQPLWNDQMIETARSWLSKTLSFLDASPTFTIEIQNFYLRITLQHPILDTADKEKHLLASFSTLMIETLKKQFKNSLRGHKIVLTHQQTHALSTTI